MADGIQSERSWKGYSLQRDKIMGDSVGDPCLKTAWRYSRALPGG
jgi:hypothetical protein